MKESRRSKRMQLHHSRRKDRSASLNMVSLMDIFTILVFFLLVSAADSEVLPTPKAVKLPESTTEKRPKDNLVLMVNTQTLSLNGEKITSTEQIASAKQSVIPELITTLRKIDKESRRANADKPISKRGVTIMGDKKIEYEILKKIMLSCASADFTNISLAVVQKPPVQE